MHEGEAVKAMQKDHPQIFSSNCTVHCVISTFSSMEESINASRSITMQSTSVRQAPNCFNFVYQELAS